VRYRLMATYRGSPFEAGVGPSEGDIVLFAACPPPEELGFEPATGHWRKQLKLQDVQAVWESRPVGVFRAERCVVLDDLGDRLHIGYLGHDGYLAERLGYWQVDRGVYELVVSRAEVSEIVEERTEYPRRPRPAEPGGRQGRASRPEGYAQPGSPQDQARYLPPAGARDQASYLPGGPGYFDAQAAREYRTPDPLSAAEFGWLDASRYAEDPEYQPGPDHRSGVTLPAAAEPPLPLEAAAMRAASASRRPRQTAAQRRAADATLGPLPAPASETTAGPGAADAATALDRLGAAPLHAPARPGPLDPTLAVRPPVSPAAPPPNPAAPPPNPAAPPPNPAAAAPPPNPAARPPARPAAVDPTLAARPPASPPAAAPGPAAAPPARTRRSARRRLATERLFAELASLAAIPADSYAVGEEVDGAMCLLQTNEGFEVFHSADGNRHELQFFTSEEAACFYLFGVLAAEAVRNGSLAPAIVQLPSAR
jgi:hypothetical protein